MFAAHPTRLYSWRHRASLAALVVFASTASWVGVGSVDFARRLGSHPASSFALVGGMLAIPEVIEELRARDRVVLAAFAFLALSLPSALAHHELRFALRLFTMFLTTSALAAFSRRRAVRPVVHAAVASSVLGGALSLLGYGYFLVQPHWPLGLSPFVYFAQHDALGELPRLAGTAAHSPLHFGESCVIALLLLRSPHAAQLAARTRRVAVAVLTSCIILTFSWAWAGLIVVFAPDLLASIQNRVLRAVAITCVAAALVGGASVVEFGVPDSLARQRPKQGAPCSEFDAEHFLVLTKA